MSDTCTKINQDQNCQYKKTSPNKQILLVLNLAWKWITPPSSPTRFPRLLCPTKPHDMCALIKQIKDKQKKCKESICLQTHINNNIKENIKDITAHRHIYRFDNEFLGVIDYYKRKEMNGNSIVEIHQYKQNVLKNNTDFFVKTLSLLRMCCSEMNECLKYSSV